MKMPITKRTLALCTGSVLSLSLATFIFSARGTQAAANPVPAAKPALTVTAETPTNLDMPAAMAANGNIMAWQEAVIGSETNGLRLEQVHVAVGDRVRAGDVLASFAAEATQADVALAMASLSEAKAIAAEASANAQRAHAVHASGALSEQQVSQYATAEKTADARVASASAHLAAQKLRLKYTILRAPDSGVISVRNATIGAVPAVGAELFRMIRRGRLEWRAEVTASELSSLRRGQPVEVIAANGAVLNGKVRTIGPTVDTGSRNAIVYVDLPPSSLDNAPIRPGMYASGRFLLGHSGALTLPQQAVIVRDGFSCVFQLKHDGRVVLTKVQTGRRIGHRVEITAGLRRDALIVVSGAGFLNDGDLVSQVPARAVATLVTRPL